MKTRMIIRREKGVAALEFAIVLPVLVLLAVGICEFGLILYNQQLLINASREAARSGIVQWTDDDGVPIYSDDDIEEKLRIIVQNYVTGRLVTFGEYIAPTFPDPFPIGVNGSFGQDLTVRVTWVYEFLVSSLFGLGTDITLTGETTMKMEQILAAGS